ncbi:MAG TPA: endonuclease [Bacteroidales bacterium]|jgi:endonuclease I|nr:endonuclease [Bacteroidales bacterium]MDD4235524.1 endonuclease [Bacteroidales bacterium]HXK81589.1 endonuclease [Bacteroidales bacterium]
MKSYYIFIILLFACKLAFTQAPTGYYSNAEGLTGTQLLIALHNIIDDHTSVDAYDNFYLTDSRPDNGKVWDIYSDNPDGPEAYYFTFGTDKCGNYSGEGDCYNREHTWPQSWVNDQSIPTSDLHTIFPTDGWVNGQRSNLPYGEVSNPTYTSSNGSKKGSNTTQGYQGTVFEPIDEYKGDLARTYFYVSVRYYSEDGGWASNDMVNKSVLKQWAFTMMQEWHENDPVSQKEIDRNNAVYQLQGNRNPFIDNPEYFYAIWDPNYSTSTNSFSDNISISPNPASDNIKIKMKTTQPIESIKIYNAIGNCVLSLNNLPENNSVSIQMLKSGIYIIELTSQNTNYIKRFIKN